MCMCVYVYVYVYAGIYIYICVSVCICMCIYAYTVRGGEAREVRQESNDIPSAAILSDHTVITDHRVMDHTGTGSVGGVGRPDRGQMTLPVFSILSDHTVITDHRDTDHIVTRGGEARKARKVSNDNRGEPGSTHAPSTQPRAQPSSGYSPAST